MNQQVSLSAMWQPVTSMTHASQNSLLLKLAHLKSTQCAKHDTMWPKSILSLTSHSSAELGVYVITISNVAQLISELSFFHPDPKKKNNTPERLLVPLPLITHYADIATQTWGKERASQSLQREQTAEIELRQKVTLTIALCHKLCSQKEIMWSLTLLEHSKMCSVHHWMPRTQNGQTMLENA